MASRPSWCRLDVNYADHPKMLALKLHRRYGALALWTEGLAYAAQHLTDGLIPLGWPTMRGYTDEHCQQLAEVGLWIPLEYGPDEGWLINDWAEYQVTREQWQAMSERNRANINKRWAKRHLRTVPDDDSA